MIDDLVLALTVGGAYLVGSLIISVVVVKLALDWEDRRG